MRYAYCATPGLEHARNCGAGLARGRILAYTDDDCYPAPDFVDAADRVFALQAGTNTGNPVPPMFQ